MSKLLLENFRKMINFIYMSALLIYFCELTIFLFLNFKELQ